MTIKMHICYENTASATFDEDYFLSKHIPLVKSAFTPHGLGNIEVKILQPGLQGEEPPYKAITELTFEDRQALETCMKAAGREVTMDVKNYTDIRPVSFVATSNEVA
ncbi:hypothetical protein R50073_06970 [Maricurvus nonylphenolicus]|uniref:EthD family reductase n=1 Tax=Maricurvus nonylphenolicus TaxID=1008307 RepID=UPI0036F3D8EA